MYVSLYSTENPILLKIKYGLEIESFLFFLNY